MASIFSTVQKTAAYGKIKIMKTVQILEQQSARPIDKYGNLDQCELL